MRYRLLGRSGLRVSELCLGTMTFGEDWGWGASRDESRRIFDAFAGAGGNFIDTSCNYTAGTSERLVGEFVAKERRRFVIATKYSLSMRTDDPNGGGNSRKSLVQTLEGSLERLGTDYVDVLYVHMWDFTTPIDEVMRALDDVIRAGKVLYAAVSDTPAWVVARANTMADLRGSAPFVALQIPYSLVRRDAERELIPMAEAMDLAVTAWGVLGTGVLTGKYEDRANPPAKARLSDPKRAATTLTERNLRMAAAVTALARELGRSPAQVAINWVRQRDRGVAIPIVAATRVAQIEDNLGCLEFDLTADHMRRLEASSDFERGFPLDFLEGDNVQNLVHGGTRDRLITPRPRA